MTIIILPVLEEYEIDVYEFDGEYIDDEFDGEYIDDESIYN